MEKRYVDVAIIGAGTAGMTAYGAARKETDRIALIEGSAYGTTCARVGCMPSKLLIAAADAAEAVREASGFGVHPTGLRIDDRAVMARVRSERDRFVGFVLETIEEMPEEHRLRGHARFLSPNTLQVGEDRIVEAKAIVIATGSSPVVPPTLRAAGDRLVVNDDIFSWERLPRSVIVFGPGVIGLEIGQALHRLGVRTVIVGRGGAVGPLRDPALVAETTRIFRAELDLHPDAEVESLERAEEEVVVRFREARGAPLRVERFEFVLAATGRRPNLEGLGLEHAGLERDEAGIPRFDPFTMQCGDSPIFIAGDVNNDRPILHEAADEGRIAGRNAARYPDIEAGRRRSALSIVFCDPQLAIVGTPFGELPTGHFVTGEVSFENQGRSRIMRKNRGRLHLYAEYGSGLFLGAEIVGPHAEHLGHLLAWAHQEKMTVAQMIGMPFYHPVVEEGVRTALGDAIRKLHLGKPSEKPCLDCGPGT